MKWQMKGKLNLLKNQSRKEIITVKYIDNKYFKEKNPQMSIQDVPLITNRRCLVSANFCAGGDGWQKASRGKVLSLGFLLVIKRELPQRCAQLVTVMSQNHRTTEFGRGHLESSSSTGPSRATLPRITSRFDYLQKWDSTTSVGICYFFSNYIRKNFIFLLLFQNIPFLFQSSPK